MFSEGFAFRHNIKYSISPGQPNQHPQPNQLDEFKKRLPV